MTELLFHTAGDTRDRPAAFPALDRCTLPTGSVALAWDLERKPWLPGEYNDAEVLYIEPPSRAGYERFRQRDGVDPGGLGWKRLMKVIGSLGITRRPAVIFGGKEVLPYLPPPTATIEKARAVPPAHVATLQAFLYNVDPDGLDPARLVPSLAERYDCIGDFMCGFGNSGRIFHHAGKRFVMSDMNPHCIGAISQTWETWG